jgi:hypothetical protein
MIPLPRWQQSRGLCGCRSTRHLVRQLVLDMGFQLTFVIGVNEQGYPRTGAGKHKTKKIGQDACTLSISKLSVVSKPLCLLYKLNARLI